MDTVPGWYSPADRGPCPACGTANASDARFCQACGRPLVDPGPDPMTIDLLTAVVAELVSTTDAFALAPDADGRLLGVRDAFVAAGAILRDLPGSPHTVAAVFGPAARDGISTLTAVRAALVARDAGTGGDIALRLGIGASDVRGDDDQAVELWRGRVVDLAFRLSRMAGPGEVILGEGAYRLIRDAVVAEAIDPRADPEGDDVGPLRLHGFREMDAWAVPPESPTPAGVSDDVEADAAKPTADGNTPATIEPAYDMWAERFGTITPDGHDADEPLDDAIDTAAGDPTPDERATDPPVAESAQFFGSDETAVADVAEDAVAPEGATSDQDDAVGRDLADERPMWDPIGWSHAGWEASPPDERPEPFEPGERVEDAGSLDEPTTAGPAETFEPDGDEEPTASPFEDAFEDAFVGPVTEDAAAGIDQDTSADPGRAPVEPEGAALLEREPVLAKLHEALDRAIERGRPVTVTMGGEPGCGRTAAARWFAAQTTHRAWTVEIACRPAETGGTSWPFALLVRAVAGIDGPIDRPDLEARLGGALGPDASAHAGVLAASLEGDGGAPPEETRAAIAALLTATVSRRPLVVIIDDADRVTTNAHAMFDAVVELVDGPLLVLVVGRGPGDVIVPPLSDRASAELVERLLAHPNLPPDATASIVTACGGLPLAVEHLVAMLADDGHLRWEYGRWTPTVDLASLPLPADLPSLVARRVGGLAPVERGVASAAAVAGGAFDPGLIATALELDLDEVLDACTALADRGILRRVDEDTFSFGHDVLAEAAAAYAERDAARAVHIAAAERLGRERAPGTDVDEAIGAHLERAFRFMAGDPAQEALGRRAAEHLVHAARGAADVGDEDGSLSLLRRAASALPADDAERGLLLLDSAATLAARDERGSAERLLGDAIRAARATGDDLLEVRALVTRARLATASRIEDQIEALRDASEAAIALGTAREDPITAAVGWSARGWVHTVRGHFAGAADAFEHAADAAAAAGRRRDELSALRDLAAAIVDGPAPVDEGIARCTALVERTHGTAVEAESSSALAVLLARAGRTDEAARTMDRVAELATGDESSTTTGVRAALVALHTGGVDRAEAPLRAALDIAERASDRGAILAWLAYALTELDRTEEAMSTADDAASRADEDDVLSQVTWRAAKARCLAAAGRYADARALVRLALRLADQTDLSELRARTRLDLAEVLLASGRANEAAPATRAALRALERKGSVAEAARARAILDRTARRSSASTASAAHKAPTHEPVDPAADLEATGEEAAAEPRAPIVASTEAPTAEPSPADESADGSKRDRHWFW